MPMQQTAMPHTTAPQNILPPLPTKANVHMAADINRQLERASAAGFLFPPLIDATVRFSSSSILHGAYAVTTAALFSAAAIACASRNRINQARISKLSAPLDDDALYKRSAQKHLRRLTWSSFGAAAAAVVGADACGAFFFDSSLFGGNPVCEAVAAAAVMIPSAYHLIRSPEKLNERLGRFWFPSP